MKAFNIVVSLGLVLLSAPSVAKDDVRGSKDYPLISRFPDTYIQSYHQSEYEEFMVATGPLKTLDTKEALPPVMKLEGQVTSIGYVANDKKYSALQIYRNYEKALAKVGFEPIFSCKGDTECGQKFVTQMYWYGHQARQGRDKGLDAPNMSSKSYQYYYWSGKARIQDKELYAALLVGQYNGSAFASKVVLDIGEIEVLDTDRISINVDGMSKSIAETGKVELEGVLFDTAKATLKTESSAVVKTIADYLKQNAEQSFYVVGHTDNQGDFAFNMKLSKDRANTVVHTLISEEGIDAKRLTSAGVGPVSPVRSNATEKGKAANRRVELVLAE